MKTKRLLSFAVATSMLFSLLNIGAFANEVKKGALSIKSPDPITVGTETVDVDFTLTFDEETKSPHSLCTINTDLELTALAVKTVDGEEPPVYNGSEGEPDDGLVFVDTVVISNDGADLANKKVIFESGVDSNAPVVTEIVFTATFNTAAKAEGTYTVGATVDATNYDENDFNITVGEDAVVTIEEAHEHSFTGTETTAPTCTEDGVKTFTCECGKDTYTEKIPALGHTEATPVIENQIPATCTADGSYDEVVYCSVCNAEISRTPKTVVALGHTEAEAVIENEVAADCDTAGSYDTVVYCSVCDAEISRVTTPVEALGHKFADGTCSVCGAADPDYVPECEHEWVYDETKPAEPAKSATETGKLYLTCSKCGESDEHTLNYYQVYASAYTNAIYASEVLMTFSPRVDFLKQQGEYEECFIVVNKEKYNADDQVYVMDISEAETTYKGKNNYECKTWSVGIPAKEYTDMLTAYVFVCVDGTWYNGQATNRSIANYCQAILGQSTTEDKERRLIANVLTYGAKAQVYFKNYHIDDLATNYLDGYTQFVNTEIPSFENTRVNDYDTNTDSVIASKFQLICESKILIKYTFLTSYYSGADSEIKAIASFDDKSVTFVNETVATEEQLESEEYFAKESTDKYNFYFSKLAAKDLRKKVSLTFYNADNEVVSVTSQYSVEDIIAGLCALTGTKAISLEEREMYYAMLNYSDAALAMFS